jgi:hypothetical protein
MAQGSSGIDAATLEIRAMICATKPILGVRWHSDCDYGA